MILLGIGHTTQAHSTEPKGCDLWAIFAQLAGGELSRHLETVGNRIGGADREML